MYIQGIAKGFITRILLNLVIAIYQLVDYAYQIFVCLAENNLFEYDAYMSFVNKVYIILGVVILFILAYNFLTLIIDPDKNKSGKVVWDLIKKMITTFILILICPSIFSFAMKVQNSILTSNGGVISNFFGDSEDVTTDESESSDPIKTAGRTMAVNSFIAFFYPANAQSEEGYEDVTNEGKINSTIILSNGETVDCTGSGDCTFGEAVEAAKDVGASGNGGGFRVFKAFAKNVKYLEVNEDDDDEAFEFQPFLAIVAGCYLAYCIISFCFDVAVRACKLALYEIIAPLCIAARLIPKWEDMFKKWKTNILQTYLSLFQRVIILTFGCYLLGQFNRTSFALKCTGCSFGVNVFVKVFIYLGVNTFMKQAPKLVDDIFGLGKGVSFNIKKKLEEGKTPPKPIMTGLSAVGAGGMSFGRNLFNMGRNVKNATGRAAKINELIKGTGRTIGGTVRGQVNGVRAGISSNGSWRGLRDAAKSGNDASANRQHLFDERMSRYGIKPGDNVAVSTGKYFAGKGGDIFASAKEYFSDGAAMFNRTIEKGNKFSGLKDTLNSAADKVIDKNKSETGLVKDGEGTAQGFKGANKAQQEALFDKLRTAKGGNLSLADVEEYRKMLANETIDKKKFETGQTITDQNGNARYEMVFDEEKYTAAMLKHSEDLAALDDMQTQLRKNAQEIVINARNEINDRDGIESSSVGSIKYKDLDKVRSAAENLEYTYEIDGNSVIDERSGISYGKFETIQEQIDRGVADVDLKDFNAQMKDRMDAYEHNATIASANKQKYEQASKARKDDK